MLIQCDCASCGYDNNDAKQCRQILDRKIAFKVRRAESNTQRFSSAPNKRRRMSNDAPTVKRSIAWAPLLIGKVPFGRRSNKCLPLIRQELVERKVATMNDIKDLGLRILMKKLKESEHPVLAFKLEKDLTDEEMIESRCFKPAFLSADGWDDDNIDEVAKSL